MNIQGLTHKKKLFPRARRDFAIKTVEKSRWGKKERKLHSRGGERSIHIGILFARAIGHHLKRRMIAFPEWQI